jgi:Mg-chelatase subunit ChlD
MPLAAGDRNQLPSKSTRFILTNIHQENSSEELEDVHLEERLYLIDSSGSMDDRLSRKSPRKIEIVKEGLVAYCKNLWPDSYYDRPIRIGIVAFSLLGTPGKTFFEIIIPLYPAPLNLDMQKLLDLKAKGGCYIADALEYAKLVMAGSERSIRKLYVITDGGSTGPDPLPVARFLKDIGVRLKCIELGNSSTKLMKETASENEGTYELVRDLKSFQDALN